MKNKIFLSLSLVYTTTLFADTLNQVNDLQEMGKILGDATYIATKTKLNADYVPGTVTVISGEKLKSLGINNLAEQNAFDAIVGFDSSTLSLRGAGSIYGSQGNKIKWMINDKPISSELWGLPKLGVGQIVFPIPTDAIERIEIIRGPDSSIYGGNAIYGIINIITKEQTDALFTTLSQTQSDKFGRGIGAYGTIKENDLKLSTVVSLEKHDGWNFPVESQSLSDKGNLPNANSNNLIMADVSYKNFDFWAYRLEVKNDYSRIGWDPSNYVPPNNSEPVQTNTYTMLGIQTKYNLLSNVELTAKAGFNQYTNSAEVLFFPAINGLRTIDYVESTKYAEVTAETMVGSNRLVAGLYTSLLCVDKDNVHQTWNSVQSLLTANNPKRINNALYIQDEIQLEEKTTLTIGTRYDAYSDGRNALSPRVGLVYLYDDSNIFKAQYSRAFRPPSFSEQYSPNNPTSHTNFESEIADTVELSYIYKTFETSFKTTLFNTTTHNMITFHDFTYETINLENQASVNGLETELTKNYETMNFGANMALYQTHRGAIQLYNNGTRNYDASEFALSANMMANIFATINSNKRYPTTFWYHYTGSKNRVSSALVDANGNQIGIYGTNGSVPAQDYLNITQEVKEIAKNLDLQFGVKNIFGNTLTTLYFPLNPPDTNDVPYMGRTFWFNLAYKF
jgi:iron complex outermembrane receptor protein